MCAERLAKGRPTACAEACPAEATVAGTREELLAEAHRRIAEEPGKYYPDVYGEHEVGRHVRALPVARCPSSSSASRRLGDEALPNLTWAALEKVPGVVSIGGAALFAIWWITHRREEVARAAGRWRHDRAGVATVPGFWAGILYLLLAAGAGILWIRFTRGLGAVTNLSDTFPWGLWVGFDVLCGVGLAAGGFAITSAVYVFNIKRLKPIVRPTVLTAFLGYALVVVALLFDLGRPWNIWHPLVMWNPRSVMFEVSWCVTLYLTVLLLESSGMVFERLGWTRALVVQKAAVVPLVIAGALLSTLHQSSLGSFYLIVPTKLHALWYTPLLPVIFFLSAFTVGFAMVIAESRLSSKATGHRLEMPILMDVARALLASLGRLCGRAHLRPLEPGCAGRGLSTLA